MAAMLTDRVCAACGTGHTLCLPAADALQGGTYYDYDCPATGLPVRFLAAHDGDPADACPADAVVIRPAG